MIDIAFPDNWYLALKNALLTSELESTAIVLAKAVSRVDGHKLLVVKIHYPYPQAYSQRTAYSAQLSPEYLAPIVKQAIIDDLSIIFAHTHPNAESIPTFSRVDDDGEIILSKFLEGRGVNGPNAALVISSKGCQARKLGTKTPIRVVQVGLNYDIFYNPLKLNIQNEAFERQVRAFGIEGQEKIKQLTVGIVGLGGTGSVVSQQLAHLGIEKYLLIDPDIIEESNLNRLASAGLKDVGSLKTKIAERYIKSVNPIASITTNEGTILDSSIAKLLINTDFIFCCTDSHGSRVVLNQISYQYYIPCIDMGVSITSKEGKVTHITGRVQMLSPGLNCLICGNLLDSEAVRRDLMSLEHRQMDPYIIGEPQPQPAVMSINSTMASLAITMFLGAVTGIPAQSRYQIYNGITGTIRTATGVADTSCIVCSKRGSLGKGNDWPLPARQA